MTLEKVIKDFEENAEECNRVADTQKFDEGNSINNWYYGEANYSQQVAEWLKELKKYKQAFGVACELLNDCILYGYDTDRIFEIMMDRDGVVDAESYEKFILDHLSELTGEEK